MKNAVAALSLLLLGPLLFWWSGRDTGLPEQVDADRMGTTTSNEKATTHSPTPDRQSVPGARGAVLTRYRSDFTRGSPRTP